jgi:hypothetical protein
MPTTPKLNMTLLFLKQNLLLATKYSQKFTFNFIKLFKYTSAAQSMASQQINFNELNLRKCLTIRVGHETRCSDEDQAKNGKSLLQVPQGFHNPC